MAEYIDRAAVLALTDDYELTLPEDEIFFEYIDPKKVAAIPAADVAPVRHGRWIEEEDPNGDPYYVCSVCNAEFVCVEGTPDENQYYYCPNCGARMDEEDK